MSDDVFEQAKGPACLDFKETVIAQYANSNIMLSLLQSIDENIKVCGFFDDFYRFVWNINTATGFGLDIWGRIVGVTRTARSSNGFFWGFNEESLLLARPYHDVTGYDDSLKNDPDRKDFYYGTVGTFRDFQGDPPGSLMVEISFKDEDFRKLILAKAYANISDYSITSINFLLMALLGGNNRHIYVQDNLDMTMTIIFDWLPTNWDVALIYNAGMLSRPAGVEMKINVKVDNN